MARGNKRSFFERLTGSVDVDEYEDEFDEPEELYETEEVEPPRTHEADRRHVRNELLENEEEEGQLTVDVYQTSDDIVIKSIVAGVVPNDLDISITRDMVTIRGRREEEREVDDENYFQRELYWGSFSRTILLPAEIEVEEAEAQEKHGLLTIRLPKIDKEKQTKLKVKFG